MSRFLKTSLLAGASALAIVTASPADAFDRVNWQWDATVTETVVKDVNVQIDMTPTGMVMVEDLQVNIGDVTATSTVTGIENGQPQEGGLVDLGTQDIQFHYGLGGPDDGVVVIDDEFKSPSVIAGTVDEGDQFPNINGTVTATIDLGEVEVPSDATFDALTELPSVVSSATAVANNTSISSSTAVELHEGQFAFNTPDQLNNGNVNGADVDGVNTDNSNLTAAGVLGVYALTGSLESAKIKATSTVSDILNASVDSSATAVANNMSISLDPATATDSLVIADIVQFAYADVTAVSKVSDVTLVNYTGLGSLAGPVVNSLATAVGNNKSISVSAPAPVVVTP